MDDHGLVYHSHKCVESLGLTEFTKEITFRSFQGKCIIHKVENGNTNEWEIATKLSGIDKNAQQDMPRLEYGPSYRSVIT
jgi:hypothetical protein